MGRRSRRARRRVISCAGVAIAGGALVPAALADTPPNGTTGAPAPPGQGATGVSGSTGATNPVFPPPGAQTGAGQRPNQTTTTTTPSTTTPPAAVGQRQQGVSSPSSSLTHVRQHAARPRKPSQRASGPSSIALPPLLVANQFGALPTSLAASVSETALRFFRIPLFLLPVYQAAGIQYGVPWQLLAAINEVETDYGRDLSVSSAGAVGWMQFLPETWLSYGVDALNAGVADPYNPLDAIYAAARYLRAAGIDSNLRGAILAYNHSDAYVQSVLLRAQLIATYPTSVVAGLTGLAAGRPPLAGAHVGGVYLPPQQQAAAAQAASTATAAAPALTASLGAPAGKRQAWVQLIAAGGAPVVAVQDGRVVQLGQSRHLGRFVRLRDVYGDVYTYAGLGRLAARYPAPPAQRARVRGAFTESEPAVDPPPRLPASAGHQPLTIAPGPNPPLAGPAALAAAPANAAPAKERLFANPGRPDDQQVLRTFSLAAAATQPGARWLPLRSGAIVTAGTVLGSLGGTATGNGQMRFSITPAGDGRAVDPRPVIANWTLLQQALSLRGAAPGSELLGATAADVFLESRGQLQQQVLSDPGISIYACGRQDVAAGLINHRVLAVLEYLSRVGLKPTVSALRCGHSVRARGGNPSAHATGNAVDISAINGTAIYRHQGTGSITDRAIRALLKLQGPFVPYQIFSLMAYPGAPNTLALGDHAADIDIVFQPEGTALAPVPAGAGKARAARTATATAPLALTPLSSSQWDALIARVGVIANPVVSVQPSPAAIPDHSPASASAAPLSGPAAP